MIGHTIHQFRCVGSTNDLARSGIEHDVAEGTVYMADHQTSGRGRRGTTWSDLPGESALMSIVLYPVTPISDCWQIGWAAAVAVVDALSSFGVTAGCKWPNDIVVQDKKICGVLIEVVSREAGGFAVILGIGINVLQERFDDGVSYRLPPTSIGMVLGKSGPQPIDVAEKVCQSLDLVYSNGSVLWPETSEWYADSLVVGGLQAGTDMETGRQCVGRLTGVRPADGAAIVVDSEGGIKYLLPEAVSPL